MREQKTPKPVSLSRSVPEHFYETVERRNRTTPVLNPLDHVCMNKHMNRTSDATPSEPQPLQVVAGDVVEVKVRVKIQDKDPSRSRKDKIRSAQIVGDDYTVDTRKWNKKHRVIDVDNDWYSEKIIDSETGEILHFCEEPLIQHRGRGSAKQSHTS
jgi:hypothetical protein